MRMTFVFDDEKLASNGLTMEECLQRVRKYFRAFEGNHIVEIEPGVFEGEESDMTIFMATLNFQRRDWFMDTIQEWKWLEDDEWEDVLQVIYTARAQNNM